MDTGSAGWREDEDRFGREYRNPASMGDEIRRWPGTERGFSGSSGYGGRGFDEQGYGRGAYGAYGAYGGDQGWGRDRWESRGGEERERPSGFMNRSDWRGNQGDWRGTQHGEFRGMQGEHRGMQGRGQFVGKGPRGYRRSDERIREDICDALTRDPEVDATDIEVKVASGIVTLTGNVEDRHQKRLAENCAEYIQGVLDVNNQLRVHGREDVLGKSEQANPGRSMTEGAGRGAKGKAATERNA